MLSAVLGGALALGFLGSMHCALMCGPLALAGCTVHGATRLHEVVAYSGGRLVSYAFVGALFGSLGAEAQRVVPAVLLQHALLFIVAALSLIKGVTLIARRAPRTGLVQIGQKAGLSSLASHVARLVPRRGLSLGLVTGGLPCGLLAGGWALAASSGSPIRGSLTMAVFFLATAPALLAAVLLAKPLARGLSPAFQGLLWCSVALWIGVRPLMEHAFHLCH